MIQSRKQLNVKPLPSHHLLGQSKKYELYNELKSLGPAEHPV